MTLLMLYLLATLDGALCGFRAAAGRCPFIRLRRYYSRALFRGVLVSQIPSFLALLALFAALKLSRDPAALRAELVSVAGRMLWIFLPYAAIVLSNLTLRAIPSTDIRSATSVFILGPATALRPLVMIAGVLFGIWSSSLLATRLLGLLVLALMLSLDSFLNYLAARRQTRELAELV